MNETNLIQPLDPNLAVNPSPFRDLIGMRVASLEPNRAVVEIPVTPMLLNYAGSLHGGAVASVIDMAGALAGCHSSDPAKKRVAVTLTFTSAFIGTVLGGTVRAVGVKLGGGRQIFNSSVEVFDGAGKVIACGQGTYRYLPGSEEA